MKKNLLALGVAVLALAIAGAAFAEGKKGDTFFAKKGKKIVWGSIEYKSMELKPEEGDGTDHSEVKFMPAVGYFMMDNLAISGIPIYKGKSSGSGDSESSDSTYGLAADGRYFYKASGTTFIDVGATLGYLMGSAEAGGDKTEEHSGLYMKLSGGVVVSFGKRFGGFAGLNLGYERIALTTKPEAEGAKESDTTDAGIVADTMFGVYF